MTGSLLAEMCSTKTIALLIFTLCPLYYASYRLRVGKALTRAESYNSKDDFANQWTNVSILGPFDPSGIRKYCDATKWRPNLIFTLDEVPGGIGNIRLITFNFIIHAIDSGAAIRLPGSTMRSASDLTDLWHGQLKSFSRMWDEQHFMTSISEVCPGMQVHQPGEKASTTRRIDDVYESPHRRVDWDPDNTREATYEHTTRWLQDHNVDLDSPTEVTVRHDYWEIETRALGQKFRLNFGKMFATRHDCRRWAAMAVANLASKYTISIDATEVIHTNAYYGAHLRTEQDAAQTGWFKKEGPLEVGVNYTEQTDAYLAHAAEYGLRVMYVATGNATELARFTEKAANASPPVQVTSKWDLLSQEDVDALSQLDWDQQALVDLEILMRCTIFGGMAKSSFSFTISTTRMAYLEAVGKPLGYNWRMPEIDGQIAFDDGLSRILGRNRIQEERGPAGFWP